MTTKDKRYPAFIDTDPMPFGKHRGELLQDVPASYLGWLWGEIKEYSKGFENPNVPMSFKEKVMLANYIWNSKSALELELGHEI